MTTTNLSEIEIELLRKNKQLIGDYARLSFQQQALQDRISSLTLALQAAHKGIARIKKKADYHRTAANAEPVGSESESEDNGIQVSDTASGKGTIRFDFGRG